jgi:hypothetical protein
VSRPRRRSYRLRQWQPPAWGRLSGHGLDAANLERAVIGRLKGRGVVEGIIVRRFMMRTLCVTLTASESTYFSGQSREKLAQGTGSRCCPHFFHFLGSSTPVPDSELYFTACPGLLLTHNSVCRHSVSNVSFLLLLSSFLPLLRQFNACSGLRIVFYSVPWSSTDS